jgi:hypothetical protein
MTRRIGPTQRVSLWLLLAMVAVPAAPTRSAAGTSPAQRAGFIKGVCKVSDSVADRPADDPHSSTFASPGATWFANSRRSLWAWWWGKTSAGSYKVLWIRPVGAKLTVTGHRLDADAAPLSAYIPGGYPYTFQASGLRFSTPGCWQVDASAGDSTLTFVVSVQ